MLENYPRALKGAWRTCDQCLRRTLRALERESQVRRFKNCHERKALRCRHVAHRPAAIHHGEQQHHRGAKILDNLGCFEQTRAARDGVLSYDDTITGQ